MSLEEALERYAELSYDFLCISDHMKLTLAGHRRLLLIPGIEWNLQAGGEHMGIYSFRPAVLRRCLKSGDQLGLLRYLREQSALAVLNHPN